MASLQLTQPTPSNQEQIEFWNGTAAERWLREQELLDRALSPFGLAAMDRLAPVAGEHVVDVGCGSGQTLLQLAERVGSSGRVIGVDPSRPLLERAGERTRQLPQVQLCEGDAASLELPRPAPHALFSRFGVMFFADPAQAFSSLRAQLASGARLCFVCWQALDDNPWCAVPLAVARSVLGEVLAPPPAGAPGPFAFASPARSSSALRDSGWHRIEIEAFRMPVVMSTEGPEAAVEFSFQLGPVARLIAERPEEQRARVRQRLVERLAPLARDGLIELEGAAWLVSARG
jgi:SAM-dependent methyltransferase